METLRKMTKALARHGPVSLGGAAGEAGWPGALASPTVRAAQMADAFLVACRLAAQGRLDAGTALGELARWCPAEALDEPCGTDPGAGAFGLGVGQAQRGRPCEYWMAVHLEFARRLAASEEEFRGSPAAGLVPIAIDRSLAAAHALHAQTCGVSGVTAMRQSQASL